MSINDAPGLKSSRPSMMPDARYSNGLRPNSDDMPCRHGARWTETEDSILHKHWPDTRKIAELTSRTPGAVYSRGYETFGLKNPRVDKYASTTDTIIALWREGHTATQIAQQVGAKTRAAVLGKLNRLGLLGFRGQHKKPTEHHRAKHREAQRRYRNKFNFARLIMAPERVKAAAVSVTPPDAPPSLSVPLVDLEPHHCRFIPGDDRRFCGQPKTEGSPYCAHHHRACRA